MYDFPILERFRPFLNTLEELGLECTNVYQETELKTVFDYFSTDIKKSEILIIDGYQLFKYCSQEMTISPHKFQNIAELRLSNINLEMYNHRFQIYLQKLKNMQRFVYVQYNPQIIAFAGREVLERFPNLSSFGFATHRFHCDEAFELNSDFNIRYSFDFLSYFRNLTELEIGADFNCRYVSKLLKYTLNLEVFSIYQIDFLCKMSNEVDDISREIKRIVIRRAKFNSDDRITMIVNSKQIKYFKKKTGLEHFMIFHLRNREREIIHYNE